MHELKKKEKISFVTFRQQQNLHYLSQLCWIILMQKKKKTLTNTLPTAKSLLDHSYVINIVPK